MKPLHHHLPHYPIIKTHQLKNLILIFLFQNLFFAETSGQCTTVSQVEGNSFVNDNSSGAVNFTNPSNAKTADGNKASASVLLSLFGSSSTHYLKATNFGFTVPLIADICGITVEVRKRGIGILVGVITDQTVKLIVGGTITGQNKASGSNWSGSDTYTTYGSSNDLWSTTPILTPAAVNNSNFGVAFSASFSTLAGVFLTAEIDQIRVTVDYSIPLPITLINFTLAKKGDRVNLNWKTTEEEDGGLITLQRSYNNGPWMNLVDYDLNYLNVNKSYQYEDRLQKKGSYSYRLKMLTIAGKETFSSIKQVNHNELRPFNAYPNPAKNFITVDLDDASQLQVLNINNQVIKVPAEKTNNGIVLNLEKLSKGLYIIKSQNRSIMFFREE